MNSIVIWKDISLFLGTVPRGVSEHQHPAVQLVMGIDEPFKKKNEAGHWEKKRAVIIPPNSKHECDASNLRILSLGIEIETTLGRAILKARDFGAKALDLEIQDLRYFDIGYIQTLIDDEKHKVLHELLLQFFVTKFDLTLGLGVGDERIVRLLAFIQKNILLPISTESLCAEACLSESRLQHLFRQEMGLPIRNYILWRRVKVAVWHVSQGASLTEAAHHSGFADLSHMTRTFVKTIGIPPSAAKDSRFVQVSLPE